MQQDQQAHATGACNRRTQQAHPRYLKGDLQVLAPPDVKAVVVSAQPFEERLVDGEEPPGHRGGADGVGRMLPPVPLRLGDGVPRELQIPVESAHVRRVALLPHILEGVVGDDVDHRAHHRRRVPRDRVQQWLHPPCEGIRSRVSAVPIEISILKLIQAKGKNRKTFLKP